MTQIKNTLRAVLASCMALALCAFMLPVSAYAADVGSHGFDGGDGLSEATAFLISTEEQLYTMAELVNSRNSQVIGKAADGFGDICYGSAYYRLTEDIVLNDMDASFDPDTGLIRIVFGGRTVFLGTGIPGAQEDGHFSDRASERGRFYTGSGDEYQETDFESGLREWTPIGSSMARFTGHFDGGGKTVSGLFINRADGRYQGLFGVVGVNIASESSIKNLILSNTVIVGDSCLGMVGGSPAYIPSGASGQDKGAESASPVVPVTPVDPVVPVTPVDPVVPVTPVDPVPGTPVDPVPGTPVDPVVPITPVDPVVLLNYMPGEAAVDMDILIENCSVDGVIAGREYAGGLLGAGPNYSELVYIKDCVNRAAVCTAEGYAGGIAASCGTGATVYLNKCINYGSVISPGKYCGAVVGYMPSLEYMKNCAYVSGSSESGVGRSSYGAGPADEHGRVEALNPGQAEAAEKNFRRQL